MNRKNLFTATIISIILLALSVSVSYAKNGADDGTPDQGPGDFNVNGTLSSNSADDDDGTPDQGPGDFNADGTAVTEDDDDDDGTPDQGRGEDDSDDSLDSDDDVDDDGDEDSDNDDDEDGEGERHRSSVADIVSSLEDLADKDRGHGNDLRKIALEQASSSEELSRSMDEVEKRNAFLEFLFGADFKNIGTLRSELVRTQNNINQLERVRDDVTNPDLQASIDAQIAALQKANDDAVAFVEEHEDSFSIFGWVVKLFQ
ncbi:MAG: hypothetical protein AAB719_02550 [Patescibacteria group bacterium]